MSNRPLSCWEIQRAARTAPFGECHSLDALCNLHPFADIGKHHRMLTHNVPGANGFQTDCCALLLTGHSLSAVNRTGFEVRPMLPPPLTHAQRGSGRSIDLYGGDAPQSPRYPHCRHNPSHIEQLQAEIDANAHIGANTIPISSAAALNSAFCSSLNPVVPITIFLALGPTHCQLPECRFRSGEIDNKIKIIHHRRKIIHQPDATAGSTPAISPASLPIRLILCLLVAAQAPGLGLINRLDERFSQRLRRLLPQQL